MFDRQLIQESLYDSGCRRLYITDIRYRSLHIRLWVQESLYKTADVGISIHV